MACLHQCCLDRQWLHPLCLHQHGGLAMQTSSHQHRVLNGGGVGYAKQKPSPKQGRFEYGGVCQAERALVADLRCCSRVLYQTTRAETTYIEE